MENYCKNCGGKLEDDAIFCAECGVEVRKTGALCSETTEEGQVKETGINGLALASFILGILAMLLFSCFGLGVILGIIGLILGIVSRKKRNNKVFRILGIVFSSVGMGLGLSLLASIIAPAMVESLDSKETSSSMFIASEITSVHLSEEILTFEEVDSLVEITN